MSYRNEDIINDLHNLGIKDEDVILIHSSLKSIGHVIGGQNTVINAILEVIGKGGTLVVPTLTGRREDSKVNPPLFDVENTPSWTGIIPETVRNIEASRRSYHPTHSVSAIGYNRDIIIEGHERSISPCDKCSPYFKIAKLSGHILLIGVDQESDTSVHSCEELAEVPYHLQKEYTEVYIRGYEGKSIRTNNKLHNWVKPPTDFNKLDDLYYKKGIMKISKVGNAITRLINAKDMFDFTIELLKKDPLFLQQKNLSSN